jgi:parallel beta-helix repeat protein
MTANRYGGILLGLYTYNTTVFDNTITNEGFFIGLDESDNNTISGNIVTNASYGISLDTCSGNNVSGNIIRVSDDKGISLMHSSDNNTFCDNTIADNRYGIWIRSSSGNRIYHNNFFNNTKQVYSNSSTNTWDDGYPSGGNHWSNYTGADLYSGPYQNVTGSDGIGDTPYVINADNQDHYPRIKDTPVGLNWVLVAIIAAIATAGAITVVILLRRMRKRPPTSHPKIPPPPPPSGT